MIETILITGAGSNGITGRLIKEHFITKYNILAPNSHDLDLTNGETVCKYFSTHNIDYVIHCATFRLTSNNLPHMVDEELESNLRMFYSLASQSDKFKKMIYFGSGAEFDKSRPIVNLSEKDFGYLIPKDKYGFGKYIMNTYTLKSDNIINLRLFGTINPYEKYTKNVISNLCVKAIKNIPLTLKQDCRFSFFNISDLNSILEVLLLKPQTFHDYNLTFRNTYLLSEIAKIIVHISGKNLPIQIEKKGLNLEYTGCSKRFISEFGIPFSTIEEGISQVYKYYVERETEIDLDSIELRWRK